MTAMRRLAGSVVALMIATAMALPASAERAARKEAQPPAPSAIEIQSQPITAFEYRDPERRRFGALEYRGGLTLTSSFGEFGGISAISMAADGANFLALTDRGWWLRGRLTYDGDSKPSGIADAEMAPLIGPDGRTLASRRWYDTEALARDGGIAYVGIERVHRIVRFDIGREGLTARGRPIEVPAAFRSFPSNGSIEALAFVPRGVPNGGSLIAIAERAHDAAGDHLAFLIGGPRPGGFTIKRRDGFDVSDAAVHPNGDLLVLERKFGWTTGLFIRLRRIAGGGIAPGALVDGTELLNADLGHQIDNMEALGVHRTGGATVLTLVSDNNFSGLQRNLLLQFTLIEK